MQTDILYELALRELSSEDTTEARLREAEIVQFAAPVDKTELEESSIDDDEAPMK